MFGTSATVWKMGKAPRKGRKKLAKKMSKYALFLPNAKQLKKLRNRKIKPESSPVLPINIYIEIHSSRECTVHWMVKGLTKKTIVQWMPFIFHILIENTENKFVVLDEYIRDQNASKFKVPIHLKPGRKYSFQIRACSFEPSAVDMAFGSLTHTSDLTTWELNVLMQKAKVFLQSKGNTIAPVKFLYRNKPRAYFDRIQNEKNGLMEVYTKDWNGDPGCPINGKVDGLFFNTKTDPKTGKMPSFSPFGDTRLIIPTQKLLKGNLNIYFADFYCLRNDHYVTLVVTKPGSKADQFCSGHLLALSRSDFTENPFFVQSPSTNQFFCSTHAWVELLYTENIDISRELRSGKSVFHVRPIHRGSSTLYGVPKNTDCSICNIY